MESFGAAALAACPEVVGLGGGPYRGTFSVVPRVGSAGGFSMTTATWQLIRSFGFNGSDGLQEIIDRITQLLLA